MRRLINWLVLPVLLVVVGCKADEQTVGGVRRETQVKSIVSLSPSTTEIISTQTGFNTLKGRTSSCNWPENSLKKVPIVASVKPEYEKITAIKPDLIVYDASTYSASDIEKIKQLGFQTFEMSGDTVDGYITDLYRLASVIGIETTMSSYIEKVIAASKGDAIDPQPKVAAMMAGWGGAEHYIAGVKSFTADAIKQAGGLPIGPDSNKFEKLNPEFLVSQNPDVIVIGVPVKDKPAALKKVYAITQDPRLKTVKAIKSNNIVAFDEDILIRRGGRVDKLIENMHKALSGAVGAQ